MIKPKLLLSCLAFSIVLFAVNLKIELPEAKWRADLDLAMREKANGLWFYDRNQSLIRVIKPHQKKNQRTF